MRRLLASCVLTLAALGLATPAAAQTACDSYSGGCVGPGREVVGGVKLDPPAPGGLPFTGAELTLLTMVGAGAVAGGGALVVASRRRARATA